MRLRCLVGLSCASTVLCALSFLPRARADDPPSEGPIPGESSLPPAGPTFVPPPVSSSDPRPHDPQGTTSIGAVPCAGCDVAGVKNEGGLRAGYAGGQFFVRDRDDDFYLVPAGRLQIDTYGFAGRGVVDYQRADGTGLKTNMRLSRVRLELAGRILKHWYFWVAGEFGGNQPLDAAQKPTSFASAADAFIGYDAGTWFRLQVGQFDAPFTMENVTSDKWLSFMERSLTVRAVGAPFNKDLGVMVRGATPAGHLDYALAFMGGDGQNRPSVDNRGDGLGRILLRPFASLDGSIVQRFHIGVSGRIGRRDPAYVRYDAPRLATPGGYAFWSPTYGSGLGETHVIPSNVQRAGALELFLPLGRFDVQAEAVFVHEGRREAFVSALGNQERSGTLSGTSYYVQLAFWPFGEPRLTGEPGRYADPKIATSTTGTTTEAKRALQLVVRWEQLFLDYDSVARSYQGGVLLPGVRPGALDAATTAIRVDALQVGTTYWATKHIRLTAMWSWYRFPGGEGDNQALAPGVRANANDPSARSLHEISARIALAL
jgi:phosphate-selective porin